MEDNFINELLIRSINCMATKDWSWPPNWDSERKLIFLKQCMDFAEKNEFYEQCAIIRDVEKTINK